MLLPCATSRDRLRWYPAGRAARRAREETAWPSPSNAPDPLTELDRQTGVLVDSGYPALARMSEQAFRRLVEPLASRLPDEDFVLVVTGDVVPVDRLIERTGLNGKPGFSTMDADDAGGRRVTGIWLSKGAPRLGWCWGRQPALVAGHGHRGGPRRLTPGAPRPNVA
jgi:hypothetical protein